MRPTAEQLDALDLFNQGGSMVVEAGAGTGKTSTLRLMAYGTRRRGHYLAYNNAIAADVKRKMPERCSSSTVHSLAMRAVGGPYRHRINGPRMASREIARRLGIERMAVQVPGKTKVIQDGFLGSLAMKAITRYCQSADPLPTRAHVPFIEGIDWPDPSGRKIGANNARIAQALEPALHRAWADIITPDGQLPFKHDHYLKIWALTEPYLPLDYIMLDEAQDANPVIAQVIAMQDHAQQVLVGDGCQAIYEFTGAVNAMENFPIEQRRFLSQSFRFGPAIAERANVFLQMLAAPIRLTGLDSITSSVGDIGRNVNAVLTRTNAQAVHEVIDAFTRGLTPCVVGGGEDVVRFARGAQELQQAHWTTHPELACFSSWSEVQRYTEEDPSGGELRLLVDLVDEFGVETILKALDDMPKEADADLIISTAHKAKGREWGRVRIAEDFAMIPPSKGEHRLQYVTVTRAQFGLDDLALATDKPTRPAPVKVTNEAEVGPLTLDRPSPLALPAGN